jgi:Flp pilus assembly protein TadG
VTLRNRFTLIGDRTGATAMEFAIISLPLVFLIFGAMDLAYQSYASAVVQGTTQAAARKAVLENATTSAIETFIRAQVKPIATGTNVTVTADSFLTYSKIGKPEKLTTDVNKNNEYDKAGPDCFIDDNLNNQYDSASQGRSGLGTAEDSVRYSVSVTYDRLTPVAKLMGFNNRVTITRSTFMKNEPYAGVVDPPTKCGV